MSQAQAVLPPRIDHALYNECQDECERATTILIYRVLESSEYDCCRASSWKIQLQPQVEICYYTGRPPESSTLLRML